MLVAAATGVSLVRQAGALDTMYAEDGAIFLAGAYQESSAVFSLYAGYLHIGPRVIAELVALLPAGLAAAALALSAAVITALLALVVFQASGDVLDAKLARYLVSAVTVVVPVGHEELPNSIANLHWPALYVLFWLLVAKQSWFRNVLIVLIALSDVMSAVFVPLAVWRLVKRREPWPLAALGAGLAVQAVAMALGSGGRAFEPEPVKWLPWYAVRALPPGVLGERWFGSDVDTRWLLLTGLAWVVVGVFVALGKFTSLAGLAFAHSVAVYALPVALSGQATPRYAAAPAMLLFAGLTVMLIPHARFTWARHAFVVFCILVWTFSLRLPSERSEGPRWSASVASVSCAPGELVSIPISPPGWQVVLPCEAL